MRVLEQRSTVSTPSLAPLLQDIEQLRARPYCIYQLEMPLAHVDPLALLAANRHFPQCYWQGSSDTFAGLGRALSIEDTCSQRLFQALDDILARLQTPEGHPADGLCFGGFSFNGESGSGNWQGFPAAYFVLPELVIEPRRLIVHLVSDDHFQKNKQRLMAMLRCLDWQAGGIASPTPLFVQENSLCFEQWQSQVKGAMAAIDDKQLEKVVLSRQQTLTAGQAFSPYALLCNWRKRNPDNYRFLLELADKQFVGSSPERLYRREGSTLTSDALAGTVRRGATPEEDSRLTDKLLSDPHLVHEHNVVTRFIARQLAPLSEQVSVSSAGILELSNLKHRYQRVTAHLSQPRCDAELIRALHPTPAVCGFPRSRAQAYIARHENRERGWYAGAIGVYGRQAGSSVSEFAVAIRSALIRHNRLDAYVGAGLVAGADAGSEWQELNAKADALHEALND